MTPSHIPWNHDRRVGPRTEFTPPDACVLVDQLRIQEAWHDLCLFTIGVDSMLRCGDLLSLMVRDVCDRYGIVQENFHYGQEKTDGGVAPALTHTAREACQKWIEVSGKGPDDYLFTRSKVDAIEPISDDTYRKIVKAWAELLGLNPEGYSTHSLRRTKPHFMYRRGVKIEYISELLGHKNTATTYRYLGITREEAQAHAVEHDIFKKSLHRITQKRRQKSINPTLTCDVFTAGFAELRNGLNDLKVSLCRVEDELAIQRALLDRQSEHLEMILGRLPSSSTDEV